MNASLIIWFGIFFDYLQFYGALAFADFFFSERQNFVHRLWMKKLIKLIWYDMLIRGKTLHKLIHEYLWYVKQTKIVDNNIWNPAIDSLTHLHIYEHLWYNRWWWWRKNWNILAVQRKKEHTIYNIIGLLLSVEVNVKEAQFQLRTMTDRNWTRPSKVIFRRYKKQWTFQFNKKAIIKVNHH